MSPRRVPPAPRLTDLELEIMQVVWAARGEPLTVRDVVERMRPRAGRAPAYTTIQTMLTILVRKRFLGSRPGPGRAHEFLARVSRDEATRSMTKDFVERLFEGSARPLVSHLIENAALDRATLEELKRRIETQLEDEPEPPAPPPPQAGDAPDPGTTR